MELIAESNTLSNSDTYQFVTVTAIEVFTWLAVLYWDYWNYLNYFAGFVIVWNSVLTQQWW